MRLRIDNNLRKVAAISGETPAEASAAIVNRYVRAGILEDDPALYGMRFDTAVKDCTIFEVFEVLMAHARELSAIQLSRMFDALRLCEIIGDGDCPVCGGELSFEHSCGTDSPSGNPDLPPNFEEWGQAYKCNACNRSIFVQS